MKKSKVVVIITVIVALIIGILIVGRFITKENVENTTKNNQEEDYEKYGYVEEKTIDVLVREFNEEITNNSGLGLVESESLTIKDGNYWYEITDGIHLVVIPSEKQKDNSYIVDSMMIYVEKDFKDDPQVPTYTRLLIMSNNNEITNDEAQVLIDEAKNLANKQLTSNNGKGISVAYLEKEDHYEYKITRIY